MLAAFMRGLESTGGAYILYQGSQFLISGV